MAKCPKCGREHKKETYLLGTYDYKCSKGHQWSEKMRLMSREELKALNDRAINYPQWLSDNRPF